MSEQDPHAPTNAGPSPVETETEPTPVVGATSATYAQPPGTAAPGGLSPADVDPHPERRAGAAFAGGLVAALFLKRLATRRHR